MTEPKADRTEMWKALKWLAMLCVALLVAFGVFKAWQIATAPARVVGDATTSMKAGASAVLNRLDVPIKNQRRFNRFSDAAFVSLNEMAESAPEGVKARGFRMTNLRGARNRVCDFSYDFGNGPVSVYFAADNAAHEAAKAIASKANRLIRIVIVSPEQTLGLNVEYNESSKDWTLGWRPSSVNKPHPDDWAEKPITEALRRIPKECDRASSE